MKSEVLHQSPDGGVEYMRETLRIADLSYLTAVDLPTTIDLRDAEAVTTLVGALIDEELERNNAYFGAFLHGSLTEGRATNGSDIDLLHVCAGNYVSVEAIRYRLKAIFEQLYGIHSDDMRLLLTLEDIENPNDFLVCDSTRELNERSIAHVPNQEILSRIQTRTGYLTRPPFSGPRPMKTKSVETGIHNFKGGRQGMVLPWWADYGLVKK